MKFGFSLKPIKEIAPIALGVIAAPIVANLAQRVVPNQTVFSNITLTDVVVGGAGLFLARRKGMIGGVGKGLMLAVLVKAASGFANTAIGGALGSSVAAGANTF